MKRCLPGVMVRAQASRWRHWCHDDRAIDSRCAVERASRAAAAGGPSDGLCRCVWAVGVCCCSWAVCGAARASAACNVGGADADQRRRDASAGDARDGLRRAPGFFERQEKYLYSCVFSTTPAFEHTARLKPHVERYQYTL